jgi:NADH-quinone oxidoreductase subunit J
MHLNMLGTLPILSLPAAVELIPPLSILLLCVAAGLGTVLLLPNPRQSPRLGGILLTLCLLGFVTLLVRATRGVPMAGVGVYFWIFSAIAVYGAIRVVTHPRPVYSALYFILTVFASAGLFILMYAQFIAAALVLIYAGAILVTYVFVIMLAASAQSAGASAMGGLAECDVSSREPFTAACVGFALMGVLMFLIFDKAYQVSPPLSVLTAQPAQPPDMFHGSTQSVGQYLFESQLVNLELAGLILTVSMVGAIVVARRRVTNIDDAFVSSSDTITANATPVDDDPHSIPVYGTTNPRQKAFPEH